MNPAGSLSEREELRNAMRSVHVKLGAAAWLELRRGLLSAMSDTDFWDRADRARIHSHFALIDRVEAAARTAVSLSERYERGLPGKANRLSKDLASRLALQLFLVGNGVDDALRGPPREVLLMIEPILEATGDKASPAQWLIEIAGMYRSWAKSRRMQIHDRTGPSGSIVLTVNGFGAEARLLQEAGLHVLETDLGGAYPPGHTARATVRVNVIVRALADAEGSSLPWTPDFSQISARSATVVRRYRFGTAPLVRDALSNWRSGRVSEVMSGNFDLLGTLAAGGTRP